MVECFVEMGGFGVVICIVFGFGQIGIDDDVCL